MRLCFDTHRWVHRRPRSRIPGGSISCVRLHLVKTEKAGIGGACAGCFLNRRAQPGPTALPGKDQGGWWVVGGVGGAGFDAVAPGESRDGGGPTEKVPKMVLTCNFLREAGQCVCRGERGPRGGGGSRWGGRAPEASKQREPRGFSILHPAPRLRDPSSHLLCPAHR